MTCRSYQHYFRFQCDSSGCFFPKLSGDEDGVDEWKHFHLLVLASTSCDVFAITTVMVSSSGRRRNNHDGRSSAAAADQNATGGCVIEVDVFTGKQAAA